jgi:hypothetical protein
MIVVTTLPNGILFDTTTLPGSGTEFAHKMFRPKNYPSIELVSLYSDRIVGTSSSGQDFDITLDGSNNSYPITNINGVIVNTLEELFNNFIESLT